MNVNIPMVPEYWLKKPLIYRPHTVFSDYQQHLSVKDMLICVLVLILLTKLATVLHHPCW